jgi:uncharacterized membrane protein
MTKALRRTQVLLAVAALGAAGMFLGPDGWHGFDMGPVASAVLYAALWLFLVHLAKFSGEVFPEQWSQAEKQAWVATVFLALVSFHVANLLIALPDLGAEADQLRNSATRPLWLNLGMLIFGWIVIGSAVRRQDAGTVQLDERDLRVAHRASRFANAMLALLIVWLVVALVTLPEQSRTWLRPYIAANVLIALLIARTLLENIYTVWRYRRERA